MHFADRLAALVEERRSRVVLGLDPDPAALWPGTARRAGRGHPGASDRGGRGAPLPRGHRGGGAGVRGRQAPARLLRAPRGAGLGGARAAARRRRASTACWCSPTASAATCRSPRRPTRRRWWAPRPALRRRAGPRRRRLHGQPAARPRLARAAGRGRRGGRRRLLPAGEHLEPGAADLQDLDAGGPPLHERLAELVDDVAGRARATAGCRCVGAVVGATRPERLARLRELMPRAIFLLPGVGAQGGRRADWARPSSPTRRRGWWRPRARS